MTRHAQAVTQAPVAQRPVADLTTGPRLREALGNLTSLMASLKARGLIHPLLIRQGHVVVCGHRRLEAARRLGWDTIATRNVEELSARELFDLELDENRERRDLTPYERSKRRVAEIQQARRDAEEEARAQSGRNPATSRPHKKKPAGEPKKGKGRTAGSQRDVAARTGHSRPEQDEAEAHVAFADRWPFLQASPFRPSHVLAILETLTGRVAPAEHGALMAWAEADTWEPHEFVRGLGLYADLPDARRKHLRTMAETAPSRASAILFTTRALPDPGLGMLSNGIQRLRWAHRDAMWFDAKPKLEAFLTALDLFHTEWMAHDTAARMAEEEP